MGAEKEWDKRGLREVHDGRFLFHWERRDLPGWFLFFRKGVGVLAKDVLRELCRAGEFADLVVYCFDFSLELTSFRRRSSGGFCQVIEFFELCLEDFLSFLFQEVGVLSLLGLGQGVLQVGIEAGDRIVINLSDFGLVGDWVGVGGLRQMRGGYVEFGDSLLFCECEGAGEG